MVAISFPNGRHKASILKFRKHTLKPVMVETDVLLYTSAPFAKNQRTSPMRKHFLLAVTAVALLVGASDPSIAEQGVTSSVLPAGQGLDVTKPVGYTKPNARRAESAANADNAANAANAATAQNALRLGGQAAGDLRVNSAASADTAGSANYATSAGTANSAGSAGYATSAGTANSANTAGSANYATTAANANHATTAGAANTANTAGSANYANSAGTANNANRATYADTAGNANNTNNIIGYAAEGRPDGNWCYVIYTQSGQNFRVCSATQYNY